MRKLSGLLGALIVAGTAAMAADDPIATRISLMEANGAATAVAGGMLKGQIPYAPVLAKSSIETWQAVALSFGAFFPEGSNDPDRSRASPKIWEDRAGFEAELAKFREAAVAAAEASGKDGPADQASFQKIAQSVMGQCKSCHESYRLED
jgi:cytochrome c556